MNSFTWENMIKAIKSRNGEFLPPPSLSFIRKLNNKKFFYPSIPSILEFLSYVETGEWIKYNRIVTFSYTF